jgi:hypothetical protein
MTIITKRVEITSTAATAETAEKNLGISRRSLRALRFAFLLVLTLPAAAADLSLVEAVKKGDARAARALLAQKADVNAAEGRHDRCTGPSSERSGAGGGADRAGAGRRGRAQGVTDSSRRDERQRRHDRAPPRGRRRGERGAPPARPR